MKCIEDFYKEVGLKRPVVITMHQKPDGDAMGSTLALWHLLKSLGVDANVISPTNWADFLNWMPGVDQVVNFEADKKRCESLIEKAEVIYCLDFNVISRTRFMAPFIESSNAIKILIDHHREPQTDEFDFGISSTQKCSTCEMIFDFMEGAGFKDKINLDIATCLYTGIMTDTGSFRFPSTTANVHRIAAFLMDLGLKHTPIHEHIYDSFLENRLRFLGNALLNRMEIYYEYNTALMCIPKNDFKRFGLKTGDTEGLVNQMLTLQGIKLAAIVTDRDEERKWSFRSKGDFDVNSLARKYFEGGGHLNAAGGRSLDSLPDTVNKFLDVLKLYQQQLQ